MNTVIDGNREPDHLVHATISFGADKIDNVLCAVYLPERLHERPYIVLTPTQAQTSIFDSLWKAEFFAEIYGQDKKVSTTIHAPEMYVTSKKSRNWSSEISETKIVMAPHNLQVVKHLEINLEQNKTDIVFWISSNSFLNPFLFKSYSYTGDIEIKRELKPCFELSEKLTIEFDRHFNRYEKNIGDVIQWSYLVATTTADVVASNAESVSEIQTNIDDFLLIASFASRHRTVSLGWSACDANSYTEYYRGYYELPKEKSDTSIFQGVISSNHFSEFMNSSYKTFLGYYDKEALRRAIYALLSAHDHTLESAIVGNFSGIETLILAYKREHQLELILNDTDWEKFQKYLKQCIKAAPELSLDANQRKAIYSKLRELNRPSLEDIFDSLCDAKSIDVSDLWPLFNSAGRSGLSELRNMLVHGETIPFRLSKSLSYANEHLQYILERLILVALGWDVERSQISNSYLGSNFHAIQYMYEAIQEFTDYKNGNSIG